MIFAAVCDSFLDARQGTVSPSTLQTDYEKLTSLPLPLLSMSLEDVTTTDLWDALRLSPHSLNTKKRQRVTLKALTRWLALTGQTPTNLGENLPTPLTGAPPRPPRPIPWPDLPAIVEEVSPAYQDLVLFAAHTGLRMGELAALTVADLKPSGQYPHVVVAKSQTKTFPLRMPKSGRSRVVPLDRIARKIASDRLALPTSSLAFTGPRGGRLASPNFRRDSNWAAAAPGHTFHDLRHTAAVHWLEIPEISELDIQRWLGHASLDQTQRYLSGLAVSRRDQHLLAALDREATHE